MIHAQKVWPVRLWKQVPMEEIADAAVIALKQADQETLTGLCVKDKHYVFTIRDGKLASFVPATAADIAAFTPEKPKAVEGLPAYPGRKWRANAVCECTWKDGSRLVGTEDGFLCRVSKDGSVYSIGPAVCQDPVRCLSAQLPTASAAMLKTSETS
ncbi:MAG: hypothetical protein IKU34_05960 [Clostridia bacterium]|nr:hypothetical protein [Clostridia bacterium]